MGFRRAQWHSGLTYKQTCPECKTTVTYDDYKLDFRPWFADGFVYCPKCQKPLRHNESFAINNEQKEEVVVDIVNKVKFSASADTSRKALTGVYVNFTDSEMQIFCTDGKRIAYGSEPCSELISNEAFGFNLPMKSVEIINNLNITATQNEDKSWNEPEVTINYSGTTVEFVQDGFCTVSKLIDGNPPVDAILGMINGGKVFQEPECVFKVNTNTMADIVKFVSSLSAQDSSVKISKTGNKLYFQSKGVNQSVEDQMEVEDVKPLDVSVTCNINYILAPLTNFATESVTFEMVGESVSPFFIVADNFKYLLMPLKSNQ
jgi:DNA polymerase III sliding clamp (beta) subunit (PCNA family)